MATLFQGFVAEGHLRLKTKCIMIFTAELCMALLAKNLSSLFCSKIFFFAS